MENVWMSANNNYTQINPDFIIEKNLPVGVYNMLMTKMGPKLEKFKDKFEFDYKLYGLQEKFINYILKTYENTTGNLGVLLNGTKGTGKTVTAKILANNFNLPILLFKNFEDYNDTMLEFVSKIEQDCVILLDEYEKMFSEKDPTIIRLMDGLYNNKYRKIFILTTNNLSINDNMLSRPSRIRYIKQFGNLDFDTINEYLDDNLEDASLKDETLNLIDTLSIITIDILKSLTLEINIHGKDAFANIKEMFNITTKAYCYNTFYAYVGKNEYLENKSEFTIEQFIKDIDAYKKPDKNGNFGYRNDKTNTFDIGMATIENYTCFNDLTESDIFDHDKIIKINRENNVIIVDHRSSYIFYKINNPDYSPSMFKNTASSAF